MSEVMRPIPFGKLIDWALTEYEEKGSIFGIRKEKFYRNESGNYITMFGEKISSPVGPAAGPNSQLAQNILASYLAGARFIELKTVQELDGEELAKCIPRPCINAEDECYNMEWSTELEIPQAFKEYVKAWFAIQVLAKELGISDHKDFMYNMSAGYDLKGIQSKKIDTYIESLKDASNTDVWKECTEWLENNLSKFSKFTQKDLDEFTPNVCTSITLSTLHGCPPDEIERIAKHLLDNKKIHTYVKCNPTLLGYETARKLLDDLGYNYISFDTHHFEDDLQYGDALEMIQRLIDFANERDLTFGVKITNTFPVEAKRNELPGDEMYMSGRALLPLSLAVAEKLSKDFDGKLPISYSGGADVFNIVPLFKTGVQPITVATTLLKPGGYERFKQLAELVEPHLKGQWPGVDYKELDKVKNTVLNDPFYSKQHRQKVESRKTDIPLPLYDCYQAPCKEGGCPIEQQIPEYLHLVSTEQYREAFDVIAIDNAMPSVLGTLCDHVCQKQCTRVDYEDSLKIRCTKLVAAEQAQADFINDIQVPALKSDKKVVVVGAGPAGIAVALFLRRNGVDVTVLEKRDRPFGIVEYVIPEFRIPNNAIKRDFEMAEKMGVNFVFNAPENYDVMDLKAKYDYVVLATGAWKEGASPVKEGFENMRDALAFLEESKDNKCKVELGKHVAVIGGGDVAMDCSRAAKRAPGVESVTIVYRRTEDFMPAEPEEIELAKKDGVIFKELYSPVTCGENTLLCEKMELTDYDASGRRGVRSIGEQEAMQFDTVICAVGARVDNTLFEQNGLSMGKWGVALNEEGEASIENVYVAGDCKSSPSNIVAAVADGKLIAKSILKKLGLNHDFIKKPVEVPAEKLYAKKGVLEREHDCLTDGSRCLHCDLLCEICCDVCPNRANVEIAMEGHNNLHQIIHLDGMCNECGNCGVFCPHSGNPYQDKFTVYWTEEDLKNSTNIGVFKKAENTYVFRTAKDMTVECELDSSQVGTELWAFVHTLETAYPYYLTQK